VPDQYHMNQVCLSIYCGELCLSKAFLKSVWITDNSCWGAKVPRHFCSRERKFQGTKVPWSESSREQKFHLWNFHSREWKYVGTKVP